MSAAYSTNRRFKEDAFYCAMLDSACSQTADLIRNTISALVVRWLTSAPFGIDLDAVGTPRAHG